MQTRPIGGSRTEPGPWKARAACSGLPDTMYPTDHQGEQNDARSVCDRCAVRPECLEHALQQNERWGTWGGLGEAPRARLRRYLLDHPGVEISVALGVLGIEWTPSNDPQQVAEHFVSSFESFIRRAS